MYVTMVIISGLNTIFQQSIPNQKNTLQFSMQLASTYHMEQSFPANQVIICLSDFLSVGWLLRLIKAPI